MRTAFFFCIGATCLFLLVGGVLSYFEIIGQQFFGLISGAIGGVTGVIGLVSLLRRPAVTTEDMKNVGAEMVQNLADTMTQLKEYEERLSTNKQEVDRLERERTEIEVLVRQASLKVFLEERLRNIAREVEQRVSDDDRLMRLVSDYSDVRAQVTQVKGEIEASGKAEEVNRILDGMNYRRSTDSIVVSAGDAFFEAAFAVVSTLIGGGRRR